MSGYGSLLAEYEPRVIHNAKEAARVQRLIDRLVDRPGLDAAHEGLLELLARLMEAWEGDHVEIPDIGGADLVRVLLAERSISQRDLVRAGVFPTPSIASEVLAGRRKLSLAHVEALACFFHLPASVFLSDRELATA
ncbi:MAG TPA: transcriptional regulator [Candidatus Dormibacteraeota bacterium]|nr:transcriptional regulator [Candidatus Dormibacteraeota bacterium]